MGAPVERSTGAQTYAYACVAFAASRKRLCRHPWSLDSRDWQQRGLCRGQTLTLAPVQAPTIGISDVDVHVRQNKRPRQKERTWEPTSDKIFFFLLGCSGPMLSTSDTIDFRLPLFSTPSLSTSLSAQEPRSQVHHTTLDPPHGHVHETDKRSTVNRVTPVHAVCFK